MAGIASLTSPMRRVARTGATALDAALGGLLLAIVAITLASVSVRYFLGGALPWSEEGSLVLWVWMIELAVLRASHMRIEYFLLRLRGPLHRVVRLLNATLSIALLGLLGRGADVLINLTHFDYFIALPWLSVRFTYWPLLIVAPLWALRITLDELRLARRGA
jgi:TRAP-type C4-dicarboxylate transport system permease small subunit